MNRSTRTALVVVLALLLPGVAAAQRVIYVNDAASGAGDGTSWPDAYPYLQDALAAAESGDEIWVAEGTYRPDQGANVAVGDRSARFYVRSGISLFGGFQGNEQAKPDRDWILNQTVLSGDLLNNDADSVWVDEPTRMDNSYQVVAIVVQEKRVVIDGFVITSGNANGPDQTYPLTSQGGAGLYVVQSTLALKNVVFERNAAFGGAGVILANTVVDAESVTLRSNHASGGIGIARGGGMIMQDVSGTFRGVDVIKNTAVEAGGVFILGGDDVRIDQAIFAENRAISGVGGGLLSSFANPFISNSQFWRNESYEGGGGMADQGGNSVLMNVVLSGNYVSGTELFGGGGLLNFQSRTQIINCTFSLNRAEKEGGAIYNLERDSIRVVNTIAWGNQGSDGSQIFNVVQNVDIMQSTTFLSHSLIEGALSAFTIDQGNSIFSDPFFVDPMGVDLRPGTEDDDLRLQRGSPAIDAGDILALPADLLDLDFDGDVAEPFPVDLMNNQRVFDGGAGSTHVDIGAYEFPAPPLHVAIEADPIRYTHQRDTFSIFPNPVFDSATLFIPGTSGQELSVVLYDILGRPVMRVYEGSMDSIINGMLRFHTKTLPSGAYFLRIVWNNEYTTLKLLVTH